jgi:hypothetical protein
VSRFQDKEKMGEVIIKMITSSGNINDNTQKELGEMTTLKIS